MLGKKNWRRAIKRSHVSIHMKVFWDVTLLSWQTKRRHIQEGRTFRKRPVNERYAYLYTQEFGIKSHKKKCSQVMWRHGAR